MRKISENRSIDAFLKLILFSGILHIVIVIIACVRQRSLQPLNYFSIIELDQIFPRLTANFAGDVGALLSMLCVYIIFLYLGRKTRNIS
jgi:hypothetical protein